MTAKRGLFWGCLVAFIAIDQAVKAWARGAMNQEGSYHGLPLPGIFEFKLTYNQGIAFGLFQGKGVFLSPVAIAIAIGATWYVARHPEESKWNHAAFGLLAAGAIGNLYDRVRFGRVTDMLYFRLIDFPVFNIADACITIATIMLIIGWWNEAAHRAPTVETEARSSE